MQLDEEADCRPWPLAGYAPGNYTCKCIDCEERFSGDKRAIRCLECAAVVANQRLQAAQPVPVVTDEMTRQAKKQIILAMQLYDFGSVSEDGSFTCSSQQIELLENRAEVAAHQALTAALTATANAEPVAWQPIETAPKGGAYFVYQPAEKSGRYGLPARIVLNGDGGRRTSSHWMPLPAAPLPAQGSKADD